MKGKLYLVELSSLVFLLASALLLLYKWLVVNLMTIIKIMLKWWYKGEKYQQHSIEIIIIICLPLRFIFLPRHHQQHHYYISIIIIILIVINIITIIIIIMIFISVIIINLLLLSYLTLKWFRIIYASATTTIAILILLLYQILLLSSRHQNKMKIFEILIITLTNYPNILYILIQNIIIITPTKLSNNVLNREQIQTTSQSPLIS